MLKEYAVALVLSTATPVAADKQDGAKQAPESQKETVTQPQTVRPKTLFLSLNFYPREPIRVILIKEWFIKLQIDVNRTRC